MVVFSNTEASRQNLTPPDNSWKMTKLIRDGLYFLLELKSDSGLLNVFLALFVISIPWRYHSISATSVAGIFELLLNIGMVVFSFKLWKKVRKKMVLVGMRSLVEFGCYIMAGSSLLAFAISFVYFIICMFSKISESDMIFIFYAFSWAQTFYLFYRIFDRIE